MTRLRPLRIGPDPECKEVYFFFMMTFSKQRFADAAHKWNRVCRTIASAAFRFITGTVPAAMGKALFAVYVICYAVGIHTLRVGKRTGRLMVRALRPVGRFAFRVLDRLVLCHLRAMRRELGRMREGFAIAGQRLKTAYRRHPLLVVPQALYLPVQGIRRHRKAVVSAANLLAPVAAVMVLVLTVQFWTSATFALALEYDGQTLGYIADESVYDAAASMAAGRVINADNSFSVERVPKLTLTLVKKDEILDETAVCDRILGSSSSQLSQSSGLYVDGSFVGALSSRTLMDDLINAALEDRRGDGDSASFVADVQLVDGLYPVTAMVGSETMKGFLRQLPVKVTTLITYEEPIAFTSSTQEVASQLLGYRSVKTKGVDGIRSVTAEVVTVDGVEQARTVVSTSVVKEPVNEVIAVGGKKYNDISVAGDGKATGTFVWPLPATKQISSYFGSRWGSKHGALDISNGRVYGKPIIASDGGKVVEAGWHYSYGYYVLIDHGNGFKTRYAHCSKLKVKVGQRVAQGEYIADVGNTGNSYGAHLHFEVIKGGTLVDPLKYVQR